jgi:peptidoglycan/LPS O-acetylase OafA/YrhL
VNFDFSHPWFLGHLWSIRVQEQFYFLWPGVLKKWHRHRIPLLLGAIAFCSLVPSGVPLPWIARAGRRNTSGGSGHPGDWMFAGDFRAAVAEDQTRVPLLMTFPVVLVPVYKGVLRFHTTPMWLVALWPALHLSIAGLVLQVVVVERPYWILNVPPVMWLGRISYGLYLWQPLFAFGQHPRPWYFV